MTGLHLQRERLPGFYPIPQHLEMSFCAIHRAGCSSVLSGRTVDMAEKRRCVISRGVSRSDPKSAVRGFEARGVCIIRNRWTGRPRALDLWQLKPWHDIFGTTDRDAVEKRGRNRAGIQWFPDGRLRLMNRTSGDSAASQNRRACLVQSPAGVSSVECGKMNTGGLCPGFQSIAITFCAALRPSVRGTKMAFVRMKSRRCRRFTAMSTDPGFRHVGGA